MLYHDQLFLEKPLGESQNILNIKFSDKKNRSKKRLTFHKMDHQESIHFQLMYNLDLSNTHTNITHTHKQIQ